MTTTANFPLYLERGLALFNEYSFLHESPGKPLTHYSHPLQLLQASIACPVCRKTYRVHRVQDVYDPETKTHTSKRIWTRVYNSGMVSVTVKYVVHTHICGTDVRTRSSWQSKKVLATIYTCSILYECLHKAMIWPQYFGSCCTQTRPAKQCNRRRVTYFCSSSLGASNKWKGEVTPKGRKSQSSAFGTSNKCYFISDVLLANMRTYHSCTPKKGTHLSEKIFSSLSIKRLQENEWYDMRASSTLFDKRSSWYTSGGSSPSWILSNVLNTRDGNTQQREFSRKLNTALVTTVFNRIVPATWKQDRAPFAQVHNKIMSTLYRSSHPTFQINELYLACFLTHLLHHPSHLNEASKRQQATTEIKSTSAY